MLIVGLFISGLMCHPDIGPATSKKAMFQNTRAVSTVQHKVFQILDNIIIALMVANGD